MDSNAPHRIFNPSTFRSAYYETKKDDGVIDLGLSLRTLQPEAHHPPGHPTRSQGYGEFMNWGGQLYPHPKSSSMGFPRNMADDYGDEGEGVESKERWVYVKVNMDGVIVGRKVCILDHANYSSLAFQLEDMFGRQSLSGLRLFQAGSEFSLFYKDRDDKWRTVGDVPWKEFVDSVKRLRIVREKEVIVPSPSSFTSFT